MSRASKMVIDNATQRAIEQGRLDLRHASPELRERALEITAKSSRGGGFLSSLFGGRNSVDQAESDLAFLKLKALEQETESKRREQETQRWFKEHPRSPNVPKDWVLRTDNDRGVQTYSDGSRIRYVENGRVLTDAEEFKKYGRY